MGGGEKTSLLLFSHHIFSAHFSFFPLPNLHPSLRHNEVSVGERSRAVRARNKWWSKSSPLKDLVTARKGCHTNQRPSSNIGEYRLTRLTIHTDKLLLHFINSFSHIYSFKINTSFRNKLTEISNINFGFSISFINP